MKAMTNHKRILALFVGLLVITLLIAAAPGFARMRTAILCDAGETNCVESWQGADISMYSDGGTTRTIWMDSATGNITSTGTIAAATIVSTSVGYAFGDGTAANPTIVFASDLNTGLYRIGANNIGVTTDGALIFDCSATGCTSAGTTALTGIVGIGNGAAATPALGFTSDANTGIYRVAADQLGIATGGALIFDCSATGCTSAGTTVLTGVTSIAAGTAGAPGLFLTGDSNTGIYAVAANNLGITTNGVLALDVSATAVTSALPIVAPLGAAATPSFTFAGDLNTGVYSSGANIVNIAANGVSSLEIGVAAITPAFPVVNVAGAVGAPSVTFAGDLDSGLYVIGANNIGLATNGAKIFDCSATGCTSSGTTVLTGITSIAAGSAAAPSLYLTGDSNTGLYSVAANQLGITTNGVLALDVSASAVTSALPIVNAVGSAAAPAYTFTGDTNTGLYAVAANQLGITTNGVLVFDCSATTCTTAGLMKGSAEGNVVVSTVNDVIAAEINAGKTIVTVPAGQSFRLVDAVATAYGATCTTSTSVALKVGATTLATYTIANLVRSTPLNLTATGVALAADGASFTAGAAGDDVTVISNSADTAACTGVRFVISYVLQ